MEQHAKRGLPAAVIVSKIAPRLSHYVGYFGDRIPKIAAMRIEELRLRHCMSEKNETHEGFLMDGNYIPMPEVIEFNCMTATLEWVINDPLPCEKYHRAHAQLVRCGNHSPSGDSGWANG